MQQTFTGITELFTPTVSVKDAALVVSQGQVSWVGPARLLPGLYKSWSKTHLGNRGVLPGLVDAHTHLVYGGNRLGEYVLRSKGESYEAILAAGGGIYSTVKATKVASEQELFRLASARAAKFLAQGVTTLEIKSGYGLEAEEELKMLRAIRRLQKKLPQRIFATLLAHVIPKGWQRSKYVEMFTQELIPEVARAKLATAVDVFSDEGAFTLQETRRILGVAQEYGLATKIHAEQIAHTGATKLATELGALSADHLEQSNKTDWKALARSRTVGTVLPAAAVILRKPFPQARAMWDAGVRVAISTDHNPGSSPLFSLWLAMQLSVALGGLSAEESLIAATQNAGLALGHTELGKLEAGSAADFVVVDSANALEPLYRWGDTPVQSVYIAGKQVYTQTEF